MSDTLRAIALAVLLPLLVPFETKAQSGGVAGGYLGVFGAWASDDAQRPAGRNYEPTRDVWSAQGALVVASRLAIGAHVANLGTVVAPGGTPRFQVEERQRELAAFGTIGIVSSWQGRHRALVSVGAGPLVQRRETRAINTGAVTTTNDTSLAYLAQAQVHVGVAKHLALAPTMGLYVLRRSDDSAGLSRTSASTRPFGGIGAVLKW